MSLAAVLLAAIGACWAATDTCLYTVGNYTYNLTALRK